MDSEILWEVGLTDSEIKVYSSLIELGESYVGPLIKKSKQRFISIKVAAELK